jgi:ABC-type uncharacterized transport system substrate-binding protein
MPPPYRVRVLSSYIYEREDVPHRRMGRENRWFHGFVKALTQHGSGVNDFEFEFVRLPRPPAPIADLAGALAQSGVQLVICAGTDGALRWSAVNPGIPTLYFGAHPDNHGLEIINRPELSGVRLNLPLIWSRGTFSLIKDLLPDVREIFIALNLQSEFAFPGVRANYELSRRQHGAGWIAAPSTHLGYRGVSFLAEGLGCRYQEGPFADLRELDALLHEIPAGTSSALVGFNDLVLADGALDVLLANVRERRLPLFWINNVPIVRAGGVADFSSDFERVGEHLGAMALRVLRDGVPMSEVQFAGDPGERLTLNARRCADLGLPVREQVRARFHRVL